MSKLTALVTEWRKRTKDPMPEGTAAHYEYRQGVMDAYSRCADDLEKSLPEVPRMLIDPDGTIKPLLPAVKLPTRYELDRQCNVGFWMKADEVLAALEAAGVTVEG